MVRTQRCFRRGFGGSLFSGPANRFFHEASSEDKLAELAHCTVCIVVECKTRELFASAAQVPLRFDAHDRILLRYRLDKVAAGGRKFSAMEDVRVCSSNRSSVKREGEIARRGSRFTNKSIPQSIAVHRRHDSGISTRGPRQRCAHIGHATAVEIYRMREPNAPALDPVMWTSKSTL